jgi:transcription-repair coupling factor (superfamily II helicase)
VQPDGTFVPVAFGGQPLRDVALLAWCGQVLESVVGQPVEAHQ